MSASEIKNPAAVKKVRLKVNGTEVEALAGEMLIKTCHDRGIDVPYFCYHPGLRPEGNCRMCLVEVSSSRKPVPACMTPVAEGLEVRTHSPAAKAARADVLEFMLANHPLDCPICDKSGECLLQDNSYAHGKAVSRMVDIKELKPTKDLGAGIHLWGNRCIACTRCVRFTNDVAGTGELTMVNRGDRTVVDVFAEYPLHNPLSGNVVDLCPVGALISHDFLYQARVWYEKKTDTVCHECARGCNVVVETLHNKVKRIVARHNPHVNDYWICDHGRTTFRYILGPERWLDRRLAPQDEQPGRIVDAARFLADRLREAAARRGGAALGALGSAFMTCETLYLLRRILEALGAPLDNLAAWARPSGEAQVFNYRHTRGAFRISADRNPNRAGAELVLGPGAFDERQRALLDKARAGEVAALVVASDIPGERLPQEWVEVLGGLELAAVLLLERDPRLPRSAVLLPATAFTEHEGSIINEDGRVQLVEPATQLPRGVPQTHDFLQEVLALLGARRSKLSARGLFEELAEVVPALEGVRRSDIGKHGRAFAELGLQEAVT